MVNEELSEIRSAVDAGIKSLMEAKGMSRSAAASAYFRAHPEAQRELLRAANPGGVVPDYVRDGRAFADRKPL